MQYVLCIEQSIIDDSNHDIMSITPEIPKVLYDAVDDYNRNYSDFKFIRSKMDMIKQVTDGFVNQGVSEEKNFFGLLQILGQKKEVSKRIIQMVNMNLNQN